MNLVYVCIVDWSTTFFYNLCQIGGPDGNAFIIRIGCSKALLLYVNYYVKVRLCYIIIYIGLYREEHSVK